MMMRNIRRIFPHVSDAAIEESLKAGGSWKLSQHLEVTKDLDTLVSTEEQLAAAREELARLKVSNNGRDRGAGTGA